MRSRRKRRFQEEATLEKIQYRWGANAFLIFFSLYLQNVIGGSRGFDATAVLFKVEAEVLFRCHQGMLFLGIFVGIPLVVRIIFPLSERDRETAPEEVEEAEAELSLLKKRGMFILTLLFVTYLLLPMAVLDWLNHLWWYPMGGE